MAGGKGDFCTALCFFVLCTFGSLCRQISGGTVVMICAYGYKTFWADELSEVSCVCRNLIAQHIVTHTQIPPSSDISKNAVTPTSFCMLGH